MAALRAICVLYKTVLVVEKSRRMQSYFTRSNASCGAVCMQRVRLNASHVAYPQSLVHMKSP